MSPEEIQAMAKGLAEGQAVWYLGSAVIGGAITGLTAYLAEKGKNRATKEDIAGITHEIERVRDEFNRGLEDLKAHHQLRMVAAERRIQAHQDAYELCHRFQSSINFSDDSWKSIYEEARLWHQKNSLFLGPKTRVSFIDSLHACVRLRAARHVSKVMPDRSPQERDDDKETLNRIWHQEILIVLQHITTEVELPTIGLQDASLPA